VAPRQVRAETNLARAPGLWATGPTQLELPLEVRGLNGTVRASGQLSISIDLDVLAWICERWLTTPPLDPEGIARFTLYDLGTDLYGRKPAGKENRLLRESLLRLWRVEVQFVGWNTVEGDPGDSMDRLLYRIGSDGKLAEAREDPAKVGALRGSTVSVKLADWLRDSLAEGHFTYLRWETLRQLDGAAKRVWIYLAGERFKRTGPWRSAVAIGLGAPALASLGVDTYARHRDARRALNRAGRQIVEADARYESVVVERRPGGWSLIARRRAEGRRESERVRKLIAGSLAEAA